MERYFKRGLVPLIVVVCCATAVMRANPMTGDQPPGWLKNLLSANAEQQKQAASDAKGERAQVIQVLSRLLKEKVSEENRAKMASAIKIAGTIRAEELSEELVQQIDFLEFGEVIVHRMFSPRRDYIVVDALVRIGNPSIKPVMERLPTETKPLNRLLLVTVIKEVEGAEIGKLILEKAVQQAEGKNKENLEAALKLWSWPKP